MAEHKIALQTAPLLSALLQKRRILFQQHGSVSWLIFACVILCFIAPNVHLQGIIFEHSHNWLEHKPLGLSPLGLGFVSYP